jgi:D-glycero-alpha-D-manno-heptose-7-phosphate kinase
MTSEPVVAEEGTTQRQLLMLFDKRIKHVPIVNKHGFLKDLILYEDFHYIPKSHVIVRAKAPVRVSFAGGGTDVTYYFEKNCGIVISAAINKYCYGTLVKRLDKKINLISQDFQQSVNVDSIEQFEYDGNLDLLKAAIKLMKPEYGFDLYTQSEIPPGSGLGASAMISAVVVGLLNFFREDKLDEYQIAELAFQAERIELNIAGGWQDQYAAVFGGFNFIEFAKDDIIVHPLRINDNTLNELESNLLLCYTGQTRSSGKIHEKQKEDYQEEKRKDAFDSTKEIAYQIKNALLKGKLSEFGELLHQAWEIKKRFHPAISNSRINELYEIGRANGAIGGKVLGAGGGGYILFYCSPLKKSNVQQKLAEAGGTFLNFNFDFKGLRTWCIKPDIKENLL